MERTGALVEGGIVRNIIVWGDESEAQYENDGWDYAIETTELAVKPGIGWTYSETEGFRSVQPFPSWHWTGSVWEAPVGKPDEEGAYQWNEQNLTWEAIA